MKDIEEKLAGCVTPGEVRRMLKGNGVLIVKDDGESAFLDANHMHTAQELLNAVYDLPGVPEKVDAWLRGRGLEDPQVEIDALRDQLF